MAPEPPSLSQPSQGSSEGHSQWTAHTRASKKGTSKTVTLADAVQKTAVLSYKVLQVDVNREHGQIRKVSETRLKLRLEDLARVPPMGIIKLRRPQLPALVTLKKSNLLPRTGVFFEVLKCRAGGESLF